MGSNNIVARNNFSSFWKSLEYDGSSVCVICLACIGSSQPS